MAECTYSYEYVISKGTRLFTAVLLPDVKGKFPCVVQPGAEAVFLFGYEGGQQGNGREGS